VIFFSPMKSAIAAVPTPLVEDVALIGPRAKIVDELQLRTQSVLTTFSVGSELRRLDQLVELLRA
jgi:hypothetical protein